MELDDHITITMPEGGEVELQLAGLASRFIAGATDLIIQLVLVVVLVVVTGLVSGGGKLDAVVAVIGTFMILFGYPVGFELLARGRTPGKRWTHLRVVRESGNAVDLPASAIRNLLRLLDGLTLLFVPTMISIVMTRHNQRPGDIAAGTLVIREAPEPAREPSPLARAFDAPPPTGAQWDVSGVSVEEIATVRRFLERRYTLDHAARLSLASRLAEALSAKVPGAPRSGDAEVFLQTLVERKSARG